MILSRGCVQTPSVKLCNTVNYSTAEGQNCTKVWNMNNKLTLSDQIKRNKKLFTIKIIYLYMNQLFFLSFLSFFHYSFSCMYDKERRVCRINIKNYHNNNNIVIIVQDFCLFINVL